MIDRPDPIRTAERNSRERAASQDDRRERAASPGDSHERSRILRAHRRGLHLTGLTALALAAASSTAALLGAPGAPSLPFVVQCLALGVLALVAPSLPRLRHAISGLAVGAASLLVLCVALEAVRGGAALPIEITACAALLPLLAAQLGHRRTRVVTVAGASLTVFAVAALSGLPGSALWHLGVAIAFAATFALAVADVLIVAREREDRQLRRVRGTMLRERRRTQSREELIANLSHDLRNPLAVALGFAEMAEDESLSADDRSQALSGIRRSLWEMSQMVENVLDGSADQAGALVPTPEPLDLEALCDEALAATRILLRRRPIVLDGSLEPGLLVLADRNRLARVIGNLLGNAVKYTVAGAIHVSTMSCGHFAVIRVRDTGRGIAPEALPHIFDRYSRAHAGGPAGAGLGLAIAHRLTERMGGTIDVESELGVGSTFTVTLPLCESRLAPPDAAGGQSVAA